MYFMVDYETVRSDGLLGTEYLSREDGLILFYGDSAKTIENGRLKYIYESKCLFEICKLVKCGKNALDFYIAGRIGELFGQGYDGEIAIVSKDKGFKAVCDYWSNCSEKKHRVIIQPIVGKSILHSQEYSLRKKQLYEDAKQKDIAVEYAKHKERIAMDRKLREALQGSELIHRIDQIREMAASSDQKKVIYLNSLKKLGRRDGLAVYYKIRECV